MAFRVADFITSVFNEVPKLPPLLAPVFVSNAAANNGGGATSLVIPKPDGVVAGTLLLATIACEAEATWDYTGWTLAHEVDQEVRLGFAWKIADGTEGSSFTFPLSISVRAEGGIIAYINTHKTSPIGLIDDQTTNGTHITSNSLTVSERSSIVFGVGVDANEGITASTGTTTMNVMYEPRSTRNMKVWELSIPAGGATGTKDAVIGTSIGQDLVAILMEIKGAQ